MLESSFIFLNGVGETTEKRLWEHGITHWDQFLQATDLPGITTGRKPLYDREVEEVAKDYAQGNWRTLAKRFKSKDHWRFLQAFRSRTAYLDIETTGEPAGYGDITIVGLFAQGKTTTLVKNDSLTQERLQEELDKYDLLVTFFGSGFDVPYLRTTYPKLEINHAHFDLCFAARRLGLRGGLKHIELELGFAREQDIQGLDGWAAVGLWHAWQAGDEEAGRKLCLYNETDVINLAPLAEHIYDKFLHRYGPRNVSACR
ncbi:MAG: ribonuclease H-like domain-containing protein [Nitrospirae bacterium]|nr:ribonuclease H-like domain-containing protein [Nitrospirota bacterium]